MSPGRAGKSKMTAHAHPDGRPSSHRPNMIDMDKTPRAVKWLSTSPGPTGTSSPFPFPVYPFNAKSYYFLASHIVVVKNFWFRAEILVKFRVSHNIPYLQVFLFFSTLKLKFWFCCYFQAIFFFTSFKEFLGSIYYRYMCVSMQFPLNSELLTPKKRYNNLFATEFIHFDNLCYSWLSGSGHCYFDMSCGCLLTWPSRLEYSSTWRLKKLLLWTTLPSEAKQEVELGIRDTRWRASPPLENN